MNIESILKKLEIKGWALVPNVYDDELIDKVMLDFERHKQNFIDIQEKKGIEDKVINATHHTIVLCREMLNLLEESKVNQILNSYFEGKYILNTMGLSLIPPNGAVYTQNIHRDVRTFTGNARIWVNTLIMLDDSTTENGATWILEGSHKFDKKPEEKYFFKNATRAEGKRGDVLIFDGNIWHSAGINKTNRSRHIITPIYSKPYIKQQLDYPRAFGADFDKTISGHLKQILGYNALVPKSLDEFYQKDEDRFYKSDQG